jgi:hypothetical protein
MSLPQTGGDGRVCSQGEALGDSVDFVVIRRPLLASAQFTGPNRRTTKRFSALGSTSYGSHMDNP